MLYGNELLNLNFELELDKCLQIKCVHVWQTENLLAALATQIDVLQTTFTTAFATAFPGVVCCRLRTVATAFPGTATNLLIVPTAFVSGKFLAAIL